MEVVEANSELLSNRQVLELLQNYPSKNQTNLATILYESTSYLKLSPAKSYTLTNLSEFLNAVKEHNISLTKLEKIQIANHKPQNENELQLFIEDEKHDQARRDTLLQLIKTHLDKPIIEKHHEPSKKRTKH